MLGLRKRLFLTPLLQKVNTTALTGHCNKSPYLEYFEIWCCYIKVWLITSAIATLVFSLPTAAMLLNLNVTWHKLVACTNVKDDLAHLAFLVGKHYPQKCAKHWLPRWYFTVLCVQWQISWDQDHCYLNFQISLLGQYQLIHPLVLRISFEQAANVCHGHLLCKQQGKNICQTAHVFRYALSYMAS